MPNAIEELLRFESPSPVQARYVTKDVEHHGQVVPAGSAMLLLTGSANRDERKFPDGDRVRHPPQDRPPPGLRLRHPLLPGRGAGPAGRPGGARRGAPAVPVLGGRLGQRRAGPDLDGAGLGATAGRHVLTGPAPTSRRFRLMRTVVVGASSGLGRCIASGSGSGARPWRCMARRNDRLADAAKEAGPGALAIACDVTDESSCRRGDRGAAQRTGRHRRPRLCRRHRPPRSAGRHRAPRPGDGRSTPTSIGAALDHCRRHPPPHGVRSASAAYLSSVSASITPPWPGLGRLRRPSKAAMETWSEAWRERASAVGIHPCRSCGDCAGGEGLRSPGSPPTGTGIIAARTRTPCDRRAQLLRVGCPQSGRGARPGQWTA